MIETAVHELATAANFAALTTMLPDGHPQTQIMWVDSDGEYLLINTEVHRQKYKNVQRDPRVTVTVMDKANPYHYAEVRGKVVGEERGERARQHIDELSERYTGKPYGAQIRSERVILKITPERELVH